MSEIDRCARCRIPMSREALKNWAVEAIVAAAPKGAEEVQRIATIVHRAFTGLDRGICLQCANAERHLPVLACGSCAAGRAA